MNIAIAGIVMIEGWLQTDHAQQHQPQQHVNHSNTLSLSAQLIIYMLFSHHSFRSGEALGKVLIIVPPSRPRLSTGPAPAVRQVPRGPANLRHSAASY